MRRPRLELPGIPQHITHRGVNRAATFLDDEDCGIYLHALDQCAPSKGVLVHGYVLMGNHVHLLVSTEARGAVSQMMQSIGRRYVRGLNTKYRRTGTLWEGRYKSCLVDSERYFLTCLRYIELNPVRAALVDRAEDYPWSSIHHHLNLRSDDRITSHYCYLGLGGDPHERHRIPKHADPCCQRIGSGGTATPFTARTGLGFTPVSSNGRKNAKPTR